MRSPRSYLFLRVEGREQQRKAEEQAWREFQVTGEAIPHDRVISFIDSWVNERGAKTRPVVEAK